MPIQYCLVQGGQVIDGPKFLPKSWMNISGLNLLGPAELKIHGWLTYGNTKPAFNADTQYLTSEKVVSSGAVDETYTINNYTTEQLASRLVTERTKVLSKINQEVNTYINSYYDVGTQQSFTAIYVKYNTQAVKDYLDPVWNWINTIMAYYYTKKTEITNATNINTLKSIVWNFTDTFDETKPNVSLQSLMDSL